MLARSNSMRKRPSISPTVAKLLMPDTPSASSSRSKYSISRNVSKQFRRRRVRELRIVDVALHLNHGNIGAQVRVDRIIQRAVRLRPPDLAAGAIQLRDTLERQEDRDRRGAQIDLLGEDAAQS